MEAVATIEAVMVATWVDAAHAAEMVDAAAGSADAAVCAFFTTLADGHPPSAKANDASKKQMEGSGMGKAAGASTDMSMDQFVALTGRK